MKTFRIRTLVAAAAIAVSLHGAAFAQGLPAEMPVSKADLMVRKAGGILIDVRTPEEWAQTGVPATAHTVSNDDPDFVSRISYIAGGDTTARIALICRTGHRSAEARDKLLAAGFTNVTSIEGGISGPNGWVDADLPLRPYSQ